MCAGDDHNCPQFELHRQKLLDDLDAERRSFLKSAFVASGGAAAAWAAGGALVSPASAQTARRPGQPTYHYLPATADTVHWAISASCSSRSSRSIPATTSPSRR
jgi:hypothetical protein